MTPTAAPRARRDLVPPELYPTLKAFQNEINRYLKHPEHPDRCPGASFTCASEKPDTSEPRSKQIITNIRIDELSTIQLPRPIGNIEKLQCDGSPSDVLSWMFHIPDGSWTSSWASKFAAACEVYSGDDKTDTHMLYCRPTANIIIEEILSDPRRSFGMRQNWEVVEVMTDCRPDGISNPAICGAILYEGRTADGPGLEFPAHDDSNPLLDSERICGLTLLGRQRSRIKCGDVCEIRLVSITCTAIRVILVKIESESDEIVEVSFRVLKTVAIQFDMKAEDWNQLVFLATHRTLQMDDKPAVGNPGREESPEGEAATALRAEEKTGNVRVVSEDLGFSRSSGRERVFSAIKDAEADDSDTSSRTSST